MGVLNLVESNELFLSFYKPYQVISWNEQGEITQVEGILIIAFFVVSPCSHRDDAKLLNLIIELYYLIKMPEKKDDSYLKWELDKPKTGFDILKMALESIGTFIGSKEPLSAFDLFHYNNSETIKDAIKIIFDESELISGYKHDIQALKKENNRLRKGIEEVKKLKDENIQLRHNTSKLNNKIKQLTDRINPLETTLTKKNEEITTHEKHNALMSELLDERKSGWVIRRDLAIRTNPVPGEKNDFECPLDFDENKAHHLRPNEEKSTWIRFEYYAEGDYPDGKFKEVNMPWSCYEFLSGRIPKNITETKQKIRKKGNLITPPKSLLIIKTQNEFFKHLESHDICPDSIKKVNKVYNFLDENRERTFSRKRFGQFCNISSKTVTTYLNYLIKCDMVFQIPGKIKYKVNIKET